jgi:pimeloyl-ACP methyl ester carboxylesterase
MIYWHFYAKETKMSEPLNIAFTERHYSSEEGLPLFARDYAPASGQAGLSVIALHGLTRNSSDFEAVAPYIAALGHRVIVPDIRGRGLSAYDPQPLNYNLFSYAKDVIRLCEALGIGSAHFIGTSMGGLITMVIASLKPDLIKGVVLNDVGPSLSPKGLTRIASYTGKSGQASSWEEAVSVTKSINEIAFPNLSELEWLDFAKRLYTEDNNGQLRLNYDPAIADAFKVPQASGAGFDMTPLYLSLATPRRVLLIRGAQSDLLEPEQAQIMKALSPQFDQVDIEGVGHAPLLTEPKARHAIITYLKSFA